VYSKSTEYIV